MLIRITENQRYKKEKKPNLFKKLMTDRNIMRERLPVGLYALIGKQGAGKTSLGVAMKVEKFIFICCWLVCLGEIWV